MKKLCSLSSVIPDLKQGDNYFRSVWVDWVIVNRTEPIIPFETGIENYAEIPKNFKKCVQDALNEKFTMNEVALFESFLLGSYGLMCKKNDIDLPLSNISCGMCDLEYSWICMKWNIFNEARYELKFDVLGFYDLRDLESHCYPIGSHVIHIGNKNGN